MLTSNSDIGVSPRDNISCLTAIQEKDAQEWQSFMSWLIKLRARGYGVIFIHHATKAGDTSSGSNFKERAVDVEIKLEVPEPKERIEGYTGAQCKVSFPKWREWGNSGYSIPFIACLDRNSFEWSTHAVKGKTKRSIEKAFKDGADWCSYGWTKGQLAMYPTQYKTWLKMQGNEKGRRNDCGSPGLNGGYFENKHMLFGVNCYGNKPAPRAHEKARHTYMSDADLKLAKKVAEIRSKMGEISVSPFNREKWSSCKK